MFCYCSSELHAKPSKNIDIFNKNSLPSNKWCTWTGFYNPSPPRKACKKRVDITHGTLPFSPCKCVKIKSQTSLFSCVLLCGPRTESTVSYSFMWAWIIDLLFSPKRNSRKRQTRKKIITMDVAYDPICIRVQHALIFLKNEIKLFDWLYVGL